MWILRPRKTWTTIFRGPMCRNRYFHSSSRTHFQFTNILKYEAGDKAPSFRSKVAEKIRQEAFTDKVGRPGAAKQIMVCFHLVSKSPLTVLCDQFVTFGSLLVISYAAQRTNFETEYWTRKVLNTGWGSRLLTNLDLKRVQRAEFVKVCFFILFSIPFYLKPNSFQRVRDWFADVQISIQEFPMLIRAWTLGGLAAVLQPWVDASEGKRLCWRICMLNAAVWAGWKISRLQSFMVVRFMHNPLSGLSYTLLTSMFRCVRVLSEDSSFD